MRNFSMLILLFLCVVSSGCARNINVTYNSDPPGASLYQQGRLMGYCPITLTYHIPYEYVKIGSKMFHGIKTTWISGATAEIETITIHIFRGDNQQFTFKRPIGIEGLETDAMFGLESQKIRLMRQQVQAQQSANRIQAYQSINTMIQNSKPKQVNIKANCTSRVIGTTVYTDCK